MMEQGRMRTRRIKGFCEMWILVGRVTQHRGVATLRDEQGCRTDKWRTETKLCGLGEWAWIYPLREKH